MKHHKNSHTRTHVKTLNPQYRQTVDSFPPEPRECLADGNVPTTQQLWYSPHVTRHEARSGFVTVHDGISCL